MVRGEVMTTNCVLLMIFEFVMGFIAGIGVATLIRELKEGKK